MAAVTHLNVHVARRLFDVLTDCEIAHNLTGISHYDYLADRRKKLKGLTGREMDRILGLGPDELPKWMEIFLAEFNDCLEES